MPFFTKKQKEAYDQKMAELKLELEDLKHIVKTQELMRLRAENARLKEKEELINKIRFKLKSVSYLEEEDKILCKYEIPPILVSIDSERNPIKNDMFFAINKLQIISFDDMKKIQNVIDNLKK